MIPPELLILLLDNPVLLDMLAPYLPGEWLGYIAAAAAERQGA